jgi:hypothetical protein
VLPGRQAGCRASHRAGRPSYAAHAAVWILRTGCKTGASCFLLAVSDVSAHLDQRARPGVQNLGNDHRLAHGLLHAVIPPKAGAASVRPFQASWCLGRGEGNTPQGAHSRKRCRSLRLRVGMKTVSRRVGLALRACAPTCHQQNYLDKSAGCQTTPCTCHQRDLTKSTRP